jgi:hypothetical protein
MTNEELRLAIAKAKGWVCLAGVWLGPLEPDGTRVALYNVPDWPASIADAWELWDEMKEYVTIWFDSVQLVWVVYNESNAKYIDDITVLRAICEAWLAWKVAK